MNIDSVTLAAVVGGTVQGPAALFSGVSIDSRTVNDGDLFVAVKGPAHDGHDFLRQALEKASGAFVSHAVPAGTVPPGKTLIRVPDTLGALRAYARYVRETLRLKVVGITGTVGKTTTKEMTAALLSRRFSVARTSGNLNNTIGLPLEVARIPDGAEVAVLEMGMSTPGEIRLLSELVRPDVGLVTAVTPVHMMSFGSLDGVMEAKAEILTGISREGVFVVNADDERCRAIGTRHKGKVVRYGLSGSADLLDVTASEIVEEPRETLFLLTVGGRSCGAALPMPGRHALMNFLAASAVATSFGIPVEEIARAAGSLHAARHRGEIRTLPGEVLLYDDTYNSSPAALLAAYAAFETAAAGRRKIAVVGEMLELGRRGPELHREAGAVLAGRFHHLVAVRGDAAALAGGARNAGAAESSVRIVDSVEAAIPVVAGLIRPGDAVFVKGSRGVRLDVLVDVLAGGAS